MNPAEWAAFALELDHAFRGDFGPQSEDDAAGAAQEATYVRHLGGLDYETACAAVALLVEDGQVFLPSPGEVRGAVRRVTSTPAAPFAEVLVELGRAHRRNYVHPDTGTARQHAEAERAIVAHVAETCGEGAARWVQARGVRSIGGEAIEGEHGGAVRHRLEGEYSTFAEQAAEDSKVGLALERAERATLTAGERPAGPRRLDAAAALGLPGGRP